MGRGNDIKMKKQSKLRQYIGTPKIFLSKVRDFYVDSMVSLDGRLANNNTILVTCPAPQISQILPRNLGSNNNTATNSLQLSGENLLALYRSSVTRRNSKHGEFSNGKKDRFEGVNRSYSVGLGRIDAIDEDKPYEDDSITFRRSRSHA